MSKLTKHGAEMVIKGRYPDGYLYGNIQIIVDLVSSSHVLLSLYLADMDGKALVKVGEIKVREGETIEVLPTAEVFSVKEHYTVKWPYKIDDYGPTGFPKLPSPFDKLVGTLFKKDDKKEAGNENTD